MFFVKSGQLEPGVEKKTLDELHVQDMVTKEYVLG
jgi:hypothetical protein